MDERRLTQTSMLSTCITTPLPAHHRSRFSALRETEIEVVEVPGSILGGSGQFSEVAIWTHRADGCHGR